MTPFLEKFTQLLREYGTDKIRGVLIIDYLDDMQGVRFGSISTMQAIGAMEVAKAQFIQATTTTGPIETVMMSRPEGVQ